MRLSFTYAGELLTLNAEADGDGWRVTLPDGAEHAITARRLEEDVLEIADGARVFQIPFARTERGTEVSHAGQTYAFSPAVPGRARQTRAASGALTAPMAGMVADVLVTVRQTVTAFQPLAAVEAMKVYAAIEAPFAGTVSAVHVQKGERVAQGAAIVDIAPAESENT